MSQPSVTVGIAAYECEAYLAEAIESVLAQQGVRQEIVVVVDGGRDRSHEIALGYRDRGVVTIRHDTNLGIGAVRNTAIAHAHGDYLMFLDGDDRRPPGGGTAAMMIRALDAQPEVAMVFGHARQFLCPQIAPELREQLVCPPEPMPAMCAGGMVARRTLFDQVGTVDTQWRLGEFMDWLLRAQEGGHGYRVLDDIVLERRIHGANTTLQRKSERNAYAAILKQSLDRRRAQAR